MDPILHDKIINEVLHHTQTDPHKRASGLSDFILGAQDGLVNVLGVVLGIAAATNDARIVLVAGLATTFAESISMGAVAYTTTLADADLYQSEREREYRHILEAPNLEIKEIRDIYASKGFKGELLDHIVNTITANQDVWVAVMMAEEHNLAPVDRKTAVRAAIVVGISAILGSLVPLFPFMVWSVSLSMWLSVLVTALVLFGIGAYKAKVTVGKPMKSGIEMAVIGTVSALAGYLVGFILKVPPLP
ncbi:MAG: VIT1/CCC1 transporter family protein [Anaerolineales bacterium]|uniref:VIT1/CCC1 transporter family protein n=1 Tax=Candidatus Villigracilis affinis TaxID=3140682 RepID=UPI001B59F079|nr:VIT1/CCC1 transporter family protein [Anaerolineales bacterium]MBK9600552.1 VIT1/CCC1 transporter family protein [Anaerolineales bacterium]MBL0345470.1 VIT1/CCC1 transporter family protein [Anaerolineales bacterium]MBP8048259.1 VIT1/CCC1 transporter family protein [Anaerolineales bacterium]